FLEGPATQPVKRLLYRADGKTVAVLIRGDHEVNKVKLRKALGATDLVMADAATVEKLTGAPVGFAGPLGLSGITMLADLAVKPLTNVVVGGNAADTHWVDVTPGRDFTPDRYADIRNAMGIIWPAPIAPFHVHVLPLADKGKVLEAAIALETELEKAGVEVLVDDRDERPGVKFNDADLIGCPYQVVIGEKNLSQGLME